MRYDVVTADLPGMVHRLHGRRNRLWPLTLEPQGWDAIHVTFFQSDFSPARGV
jgi:hypothetical protein